jgi:putative oxidoreductase
MRIGRLLVRMTIGLLFVGHGTQKLFGWFGGSGPDQTGEAFESMGLKPGRRAAIGAGAAEAAGGALLAAGLATPLASAALSSVMITAIRKVHAEKGIWVTEGGFEYNAVLLAVLFGLSEVGPGPLSLDAALGIERRGLRWAILELGLGALGSIAATHEQSPLVEAGPKPAESPAAAAT